LKAENYICSKKFMKLKNLAILFLMFSLVTVTAQAKRAKLVEGSIDALKDVKKMNLQFDYSRMTVTDEKTPDSIFIVNHTNELNEKEARSGNKWAKAWVSDRTRRYEPSFKSSFNREPIIRVGDFPEEKYTLIFVPTNIEPGYNVGISRKSARLSGEALIVETANPEHVICKLSVTDAPGNAGFADMDSGARIKMAYYIAANMLHDYLQKHLK
jgi:hypothetical protein